MTEPQDVLAVLVRRSLVVLAAAGAIASLAGLAVGGRQALGALVGTFLVVLTFSSTLALMHVTTTMDPHVALGVALLTYWVKMSLLVALLLASTSLRWFDPLWFGGVVVAGTLLWAVLHVRALAGARVLAFGVDDVRQGRPV